MGQFLTGSSGDNNKVLSIVDLLYSASMTPDLALGNTQRVTINNGTAMTINAPLNAYPGALMCIMLKNISGGAAGALTLNAIFKIGAAWTQAATGFSRSIWFMYDGVNWIEVGRTAADVAN